MPTFLQFCTKVLPISTVAPFLMFFKICGSPDSNPTIRRRAAAIGHGFQRFVVAMHARRAGPLKAHRLEFLAEREDAILANVERVVVKEKFLGLRKHLVRLLEFARHGFDATHAPGVAGKRLRPQAESAESRATARGVEGNERVQQERHIVFFDGQIALVDIGRKRKRIEFFGLQQRTRRIVNDLAILDVADVCDFRDGLAVCVVHNGVIEFSAHDEIDIGAGEQAFRRLDLHLRSDEADLDSGLLFLHGRGHAKVAVKAHRGREEHHELIIFRDFNHLAPE